MNFSVRAKPKFIFGNLSISTRCCEKKENLLVGKPNFWSGQWSDGGHVGADAAAAFEVGRLVAVGSAVAVVVRDALLLVEGRVGDLLKEYFGLTAERKGLTGMTDKPAADRSPCPSGCSNRCWPARCRTSLASRTDSGGRVLADQLRGKSSPPKNQEPQMCAIVSPILLGWPFRLSLNLLLRYSSALTPRISSTSTFSTSAGPITIASMIAWSRSSGLRRRSWLMFHLERKLYCEHSTCRVVSGGLKLRFVNYGNFGKVNQM